MPWIGIEFRTVWNLFYWYGNSHTRAVLVKSDTCATFHIFLSDKSDKSRMKFDKSHSIACGILPCVHILNWMMSQRSWNVYRVTTQQTCDQALCTGRKMSISCRKMLLRTNSIRCPVKFEVRLLPLSWIDKNFQLINSNPFKIRIRWFIDGRDTISRENGKLEGPGS